MHQSFNIDKAAEHVKNIIDTNRCAICDKSNGERMRYPCGHASCDGCVPANESCPFCLIPQDSSSFAAPCIDAPYSQRSRNAINLLDTFQTEFYVDVYKRQRISEQLKVEKEVFPQCIQAPAKYYNKKKKSQLFNENKENIRVYPGEEVSLLNKMENSNANVREWLNKCVKRKPLGDLNKSKVLNILHKQPQKVSNTQNISRSHRKRQYAEIWADENQSFNVAPKKLNKEKSEIKTISTDLPINKNKDDSGISIGDEVIIIDDSQSVKVDKDMNAWLAVLEAEKHANESTIFGSHNSKQAVTFKKVPFYIKSPLSENCIYCNDIKTINKEKSDEYPNISITVESKSFTAIINVSKAESIQPNSKQSVEVQTDLENTDQGFEEIDVLNCEKDIAAFSPIPSCLKSEDIFLGEANISPMNKSLNMSTNVIIAESDSDDDVEHSTSLQVVADVHRSCDEMLVLGDVEDLHEHSKRARRAARGYTPTSTDSSDKENYNPNRKKKMSYSKKKPVKK